MRGGRQSSVTWVVISGLSEVPATHQVGFALVVQSSETPTCLCVDLWLRAWSITTLT